MSSYKEITALRKAGRLEEAHGQALAWINAAPTSKWAAKALLWVLRDMAKAAIEHGDTQRASQALNQAQALLPKVEDEDGLAARALGAVKLELWPQAAAVRQAAEKSKKEETTDPAVPYATVRDIAAKSQLPEGLHEDWGWIIFRYLSKDLDKLSSRDAREALAAYVQLHNRRPSRLHTLMLGIAVRVADAHPEFKMLEFVKLWGVENFSDEDFASSTKPDGSSRRPLAVRVAERCFATGSRLEEVTSLFEPFGKMTEEDIRVAYSRATSGALYVARHDAKQVEQLLRHYLDDVAGLPMAGEHHSSILRTALFLYKDNPAPIVSLLPKWGFGNFMPADWELVDKDGHRLPSLAQRAITLYCKAAEQAHREWADGFEQLLIEAIKHYPADVFNKRNYARHLFATGRKQQALAAYRKLLLQRADYYLWHDLAGMLPSEELKKSALCKALLSARRGQEQFLGAMRLELAALLISEGNLPAANRELRTIYDQRHAAGGKMPLRFNELSRKIPAGTAMPASNRELYARCAAPIEQWLLEGLPSVVMTVAGTFTDKRHQQVARLQAADGTKVYAKVRQLKSTPQGLWPRYQVWLTQQDGHTRPALIKPAP